MRTSLGDLLLRNAWEAIALAVRVGLGRIAAWCYTLSDVYQIR
jgi:hypothetical protein